ncbi:MAG: right-handed parallel beta-helix repeat-containing protein [Anaerolineales bacterium]|nr:right-handed parallel beta-helix repeat-containing protein [Anaerolineales bacterium]
MLLTQSTTLEPRIYDLPEGITFAADGLTLDGNGATIISSSPTHTGITVTGRNAISIKNLTLLGFQHGLYARDCTNLTVENCHLTHTAERSPNTDFLDIFRPPEDPYGGGILLWNVSDSRLAHNYLSHQMCGLLTYHCRNLTVQHNLANYNSGFGFHLYGTTDSVFEDNYADYCCRWEPRGERHGHMGADAAGFLIVYGSSRNIFRRNFARLGGDGFFLAGLTSQLEPTPCNDNLFEENDASWSPNIAFEATFSRGNVYRNNYADNCNYGFWLGFSRENILENNRIWRNRQAGIAVENGIEMHVHGNDFKENGHGILLWSKRIPEFDAPVPKNDTSRDWLIEHNTFTSNRKAIRIAADQDHGLRPYTPHGTCPPLRNHVFRENIFTDNVVDVELIGVTESE